MSRERRRGSLRHGDAAGAGGAATTAAAFGDPGSGSALVLAGQSAHDSLGPGNLVDVATPLVPANSGRLPVFLKFHKVGGTTVASCLRDREDAGAMGVKHYWCCDPLWEETMGDAQKQVVARIKERTGDAFGRRGRDGPGAAETGCASGGVAYEHNTLHVYKEHGFRGFRVCTALRPRIRAFTVLRHPVHKWLSGLYYWGKVYSNPLKRICLARKMFEDLRLDIAEAFRRLTEAPADATVRDVDLMSACLYADAFIESLPMSLTAATDGPGGGPLEKRMREAKTSGKARSGGDGPRTVKPRVNSAERMVRHWEQNAEKNAERGAAKDARDLPARRQRRLTSRLTTAAEHSAAQQLGANATIHAALGGYLSSGAQGAALAPSQARAQGRRRLAANAGVGRVWKARDIPGPPGGSPPNEYVFFLNREVLNVTTPARAEVEAAKAALRREFVVGLTEAMPSFLVLLALELGWPLDRLCCIARNVNTASGAAKSRLSPAIHAHAEVKLAADLEVYREAEVLHAAQVAAFQPLHAKALESFTDPSFGRVVCGHDVAGEGR